MAERELAILITARDLASRTLRGVTKEANKLGSITARGARTAAANLGKLAVVGAGVALVLGVGAVKAAADFESQLKTINTVAQATPERLAAIGDGIRKIARDTGTPLEELTQGFYDLVSAGVAADQAQRVLAASNRLAIGGLASAAEGVDLLTTALNSYGVAASQQGAQSERFGDIFAKAIEKGKVTAAELAASFATIGPIAAKSGIEVEELAAGYATLTAQGVPAAEAATQMRSALVGLLSPSAKLNKIQAATGVNFARLAKEKGLVVALERLRKEADKAGVPLIDLLGRVEGFNFAISTTGDSLDAYNANLADMGHATGTAVRQMSERQQGLNYQLSRLKALARDAGITIGSKLLPKLTPIAERMVAFLEAHQPELEKFGDDLASAFDRAAEFAGQIPWESVGSGLKVAADWARRLMDVFLGLPPEVQGTIVALAGLNKLTGGAVSGIVGELGKGLIKGVLGMTAGVVNINAGVVNGGGPGAPVPGGGAGAGAGGKPGIVIPTIGAATAGVGIGPNGMPTFLGEPVPDIPGFPWLHKPGAPVSDGTDRGGERAYLAEIADNTAALRKQWTTALDRAGVTKRGKPGATESAVSATLLRDAAKRLGSGQRDLKVGMLDLIHAVRTWTPPAPKITVPVYVTSTVSVREVNVAQRVTARYGNSNRIYEG